MLETVILSVFQVIPPSVDLNVESVTLPRLMTLAKLVSASLSVTVRLVISEEKLVCTDKQLDLSRRRMTLHTVTSEHTTAARASTAFVAGIEVLESSIKN